MTITKADIKKLKIFYHYLNLYLADCLRNDKNSFYYADCYQRDLAGDLINANSIKEAKSIYNELDGEDKEIINDMLRAKEINFQASQNKPLRHYQFTYIKKI